MKKNLPSFLSVILLLSVMVLKAENGKESKSPVPYKSPNSVLYGKDIVINNDPSQDQRNVHVSVAFNGWLFAVYTHNTSSTAGLTILKSVDNGITWTVIDDNSNTGTYTAAGIVVAGNTLTDLKLFVAGIYEAASNDYRVWCDRYDAQTGAFENEFFSEQSSRTFYDVAIASDYRYPASGISPYSLGIIYSKAGTSSDSVILLTSSDGGYTMGSREIVSATDNYFRKVAISYGICNSYSNGRYFAAWEEMDYNYSTMGHIWTAYTDPWIYSPIANKIKLDSLNTTYIDVCSNPTIATQFNNVDNSSGNLSEIVLFDGNWNPGNNDVLGSANVQAVGTGNYYWQNFVIADSGDDEMQSDANFDPTDNNFLVTYFDSTSQKLPYLVNYMDLADPGTWTIISNGYNDSSNLSNPYPKVQIDPIYTKVANVWSAEGTGGGVAMFDAEYSNYNGISVNHKSDDAILEGAYPNPASTRATIVFILNKQSEVAITLYSIVGQEIKLITDQSFSQGRNSVNVDVSAMPEGTYIYSFKADDFSASGRITVVR
jgi:hypothetical protein